MEPAFMDGEIDGVVFRPLLNSPRLTRMAGGAVPSGRAGRRTLAGDDLSGSATLPGVTRGPHEHVDQTDGFAFVGPSDFQLVLWDTRPESPTRGRRRVVVVGESNPAAVWIPPGVAHAYRNIGDVPGLVFNGPNRLYAGWGKKDPVDEIRHEAAEPGRFPMPEWAEIETTRVTQEK